MKKIAKSILSTFIIIAIIAFLIIPVLKVGTGNNFTNPSLENTEAKQISSFSQDIVSKIQHSDFMELSKYYSQYFTENNVNDVVINAKLHFPTQSPDNVQLIGLRKIGTYNYNGKTSNAVEAILQYQFNLEWYQVDVTYSKQENTTQLLGFHFNKLSDSLENINKVVFSKASILQYSALIMTIIIPIIILSALILCIRTPNLKRKWLWIIFIIFGFVGFNFNWTTQAFTINPISFSN